MSDSKSSKMRLVVWTVVIVLSVGVLGAIALPNFVKARSTSCANACINNLRQIDAAINQFALEYQLSRRPDALHQTEQSGQHSTVSGRRKIFRWQSGRRTCVFTWWQCEAGTHFVVRLYAAFI